MCVTSGEFVGYLRLVGEALIFMKHSMNNCGQFVQEAGNSQLTCYIIASCRPHPQYFFQKKMVQSKIVIGGIYMYTFFKLRRTPPVIG